MREAGVPAIKFSAVPNPVYIPEIPLPEEEVEGTVLEKEEENWFDWVKRWVFLSF